MISSHEREEGVRTEDQGIARKNADRRVTELMSWALLTAPTTLSCREALALAAARAVHHIPVLDGGVMGGIVCTCDLLHAREHETLFDRMRSPVVSIAANAPCSEARATMLRHDIGALPVLYHGFLIGIVTVGDLVRAHVLGEHERPTCAICGAHHHVRAGGADDTPLCLACRERGSR